MVRRALLMAALALTGCPDEPPERFRCDIDEQCVEDGEQGFCEVSNDCSFEDRSCDSGRRYASYSTGDGECVDSGSSNSLVSNGGFEDGTSGWEGENAEIAASDEAHTLDGAVKVCRSDDTGPTFAIVDAQPAAFNPQFGDRYSARAWVKAENESETLVRIVFHPTGTGDPEGENDTGTEPPVVASADWQEVTAPHEVMGPLDRLFVRVEAEQEPGSEGCFLVDDIAVFRVP